MPTRTKGASLINTIAILREVLGAARYHGVVEACPQETQQLIRRTLVATEWVPLELWTPFLQAIYEQVCRKDELQYRRLLRAVCKRDFSTVNRLLLSPSSPQTILEKSSDIWSAYFDTGTLKLESMEVQGKREQATLQMRDLETQFPLHTLTMHAYLEQLMLMAGAQACTVQRTKEQFRDGKLACEYIVSFERNSAPGAA